MNTVAEEPEGSTSLISKLVIGDDPEPVQITSHTHNLLSKLYQYFYRSAYFTVFQVTVF
jgi:hypothetical protein